MDEIVDPREANHPRLTPRLLGQEAAEQRLLGAYLSARCGTRRVRASANASSFTAVRPPKPS